LPGRSASRLLSCDDPKSRFSLTQNKQPPGLPERFTFNTPRVCDDFADWSTKEAGDAYGSGVAGAKSSIPARDIFEMAAPGYKLTASGRAAGKGLNAAKVA
jgi:hypothetical protein